MIKPLQSLCISVSLLSQPRFLSTPLRVSARHRWHVQIRIIQGRCNKELFIKVWAGCKEMQGVVETPEPAERSYYSEACKEAEGVVT